MMDIVNMKEIGFTGSNKPYGWMGNMSRYSVTYDGKVWGSVEHLFQALRFSKDTPFRELIRLEDGPYQAKQIAKKHRNHMYITPCGMQDLLNMETCLRLKLETHPLLVDELIETGDVMIYEDVTARGSGNSNLIWGAMKLSDGTWKGENIMGILWMKLREEYKGKVNTLSTSLERLNPTEVQTLNEKIKKFMDEETLTFTLDNNGKLVAIGHFNSGDDTIGHDDNSFLNWDDFIKHS